MNSTNRIVQNALKARNYMDMWARKNFASKSDLEKWNEIEKLINELIRKAKSPISFNELRGYWLKIEDRLDNFKIPYFEQVFKANIGISFSEFRNKYNPNNVIGQLIKRFAVAKRLIKDYIDGYTFSDGTKAQVVYSGGEQTLYVRNTDHSIYPWKYIVSQLHKNKVIDEAVEFYWNQNELACHMNVYQRVKV